MVANVPITYIELYELAFKLHGDDDQHMKREY